MGYQRNGWRERDTEVYTQEQVEAVIAECGIEVAYESHSHFIGYCPFHNNTESPAFEVDKIKGLYTCFNPGCGASGNLRMLLEKIKGYNTFKATRCIVLAAGERRPVTEMLDEIRNKPAEFVPFPEKPVARMASALWTPNNPGMVYMKGRGFEELTLSHFFVGYSDKQDSVIVPMHDPDGMLVGFVARTIEGKGFKNTDNLPKSKTAWNFHRAKRAGDTVIIVESTFDAMRIHQAGYPNVIALLGGSLSPWHIAQIDKHFNTVIIMTDCEWEKRYNKDNNGNLAPCAKCKRNGFHLCQGHRDGRELGERIVKAFPHKKVMWAAYDDTCVYPHQAKDATDLTDDEIRQCLTGAIGNFAYSRWGIESLMDSQSLVAN